jgi:hypothetical protein
LLTIPVKKTIVNHPEGNKWRCTSVYGEPRTHERHNFWKLLKHIKPLRTEPWFLMGDFNECLWQEEHFSARRRGERQMIDFREVLSHCNLFDLGFKGKPWTFDNKQDGVKNVRDWTEQLLTLLGQTYFLIVKYIT